MKSILLSLILSFSAFGNYTFESCHKRFVHGSTIKTFKGSTYACSVVPIGYTTPGQGLDRALKDHKQLAHRYCNGQIGESHSVKIITGVFALQLISKVRCRN